MSMQRNSIGNQGYGRDPRAVIPAVLAAGTLLLSGCGGTSPGKQPVAASRMQALAQKYEHLIAYIAATTPHTRNYTYPESCQDLSGKKESEPQDDYPYITTTTTIASKDDSSEYQLAVDELPGANGRPDPAKVVAVNLERIRFKGCNPDQPFEEVTIDSDLKSQTNTSSIGWTVGVVYSTDGIHNHYNDAYSTNTVAGLPRLTVSHLNFLEGQADLILSNSAHQTPVHSVQP
jgi:hypothetical protein